MDGEDVKHAGCGSSPSFGTLASTIGQVVSQALLLVSHILAVTTDYMPRSNGPRLEWGDFTGMTFGLAAFYGLVALLVAWGIGAADGAIRRVATRRANGSPEGGVREFGRLLWWVVLCALPGLVFGGGLMVAYLLFSWFTGDGCLPLFGGECPPKALLPYWLFYSLSAGSLAFAWVVALRTARSQGRDGGRKR